MQIIVETRVDAPLEAVWGGWTTPESIKLWSVASEGWHTPHAEVDLQPGGRFLYRMEAEDGSAGFDFEGVYSAVVPMRKLVQTLADDREIKIEFVDEPHGIIVRKTFDADPGTPIHVQRGGWQAILDNFKRFVEEGTQKAA